MTKTASDFLKPSDLVGPTTATIAAVEMEDVDGRPQVVIYFEEFKKGLLLTRETANTLTEMIGPHPLVQQFKEWPQ